MLFVWIGGGVAMRFVLLRNQILRECYEHGEYADVYLLIASIAWPLYLLLVIAVTPLAGIPALLAWVLLVWPYRIERRAG